MSEKFDHVFRLCCFSLSFLVWIISNISSEILTNWRQVFLCTCPLIDDKLHHKLTVWQLKVKLESLHYLKLYLPLLLLMIRMSQSACKKLDSYCRIFLCKKKLLRLLLTFNPLLAVTDFWTKLEKNIAGLRICSSTSRRKQVKLLIQKYLTVPDYYVNSFSVLLFVCLFFERFGIRI